MPVKFAPRGVREEVAQATAVWTAAGANNNAATLTIPGVPGQCHAITEGIAYSYSGSGTLAGGLLTVADGSTTVFSMSITAKGPGFIPWKGHGTAGSSLVVALAAGGADVDAKVNVCGYARLTTPDAGMAGQYDYSDYEQSGWIED